MSNELPMMPFWVKDWLAATMHWPCAERGAYISLLAFQWANGHVPPDVPQLARITGTTEEEFERIWETLAPKFESDSRGLFNKRAEEHRKEALRLKSAHAFGASLANKKRRARRAERQCSTEVPRDDAERTPPSPSPSPSQDEEMKNKNAERKRSARAQRVSRETFDEEFLSFKLEYPLRAGGQPWKAAQKCWNARLDEGAVPTQMIEGAKRYALFIKAKGDERTSYVMHAKTFLGPEKYYLQDWELPQAANDERWSPPGDDGEFEAA